MQHPDPLVAELLSLVFVMVQERQPRTLSLDELGELISDRAITPPQIDALIFALEFDGVVIRSDEDIDLAALLRTVIQTAISMRKKDKSLGPRSIAEESGLSLGSVKLALLYSEVIGKPK